MTKLNLGSGNIEIEGYTNIDIANGDLVYPLDKYADGSVDEIRASHILEHFSYRDTLKILIEWNRVLKIGGRIKIAVPDFMYLIVRYFDHPMMESYVLGGHLDENDYHKALFTEPKLIELLLKAGFHEFSNWESEVVDCARLPISLNVQGIKNYSFIDKEVK